MALLRRRLHGRNESRSGQLTRREGQDSAASPLARLRAEMDRVFERMWKEFSRDPWSALSHLPADLGAMTGWPAMDIAEDDKSYTIRMDVPGLDAKDVEVEVSGNQLTVRGQRKDEFTEDRKGVYRRERYSGSFCRSVTLPSYVDASKIDAKYEKGTLTLTAPRIPGQGPKRVPVKGD